MGGGQGNAGTRPRRKPRARPRGGRHDAAPRHPGIGPNAINPFKFFESPASLASKVVLPIHAEPTQRVRDIFFVAFVAFCSRIRTLTEGNEGNEVGMRVRKTACFPLDRETRVRCFLRSCLAPYSHPHFGIRTPESIHSQPFRPLREPRQRGEEDGSEVGVEPRLVEGPGDVLAEPVVAQADDPGMASRHRQGAGEVVEDLGDLEGQGVLEPPASPPGPSPSLRMASTGRGRWTRLAKVLTRSSRAVSSSVERAGPGGRPLDQGPQVDRVEAAGDGRARPAGRRERIAPATAAGPAGSSSR